MLVIAKYIKVARLAKSIIYIPFIMGHIVGLGLQNPELKILFQSDIRLLRYYMSKSGKSTTSFYFLHFCQSPVANMAANYVCIKQKTKVYGKRR